MKTLTSQSFAKAKAFIMENARPLEQRLFAYHFEGGPPEAVLEELARFQNEDGGFGQALEPDFRLPASSPLATSVAFQKLRHLREEPGHPLARALARPLAQDGIRYLLASYDAEKGYWPAVPPEVNTAPHAPWWHYDPQAGRCAVETPANPSAEITGYLYAYPEQVPGDFLSRVTESALSYLQSHAGQIEMHGLFCYIRLSEELSGAAQESLVERLKSLVSEAVARDPQSWAEYGPQPLMFATSPQSPLVSLMPQEIEANLDYRIEGQDPGGSWSPNWTWGENYPEAWPQARQEWQGVLTLENLLLLRRFGRLESR